MAQASLPLVARVSCCGFSSAVGKGCRRVLVREMKLTGSAFLEALSS